LLRVSRATAGIGLFVAAITLSRSAAADDTPTVAASDASQARTEWYGWQILIADASSAGLVLASTRLSSGQGFALVPGLVGYAVGGPFVHEELHRQHGKAAASVILRVAALPVGAAVGWAVATLTYSRRNQSGLDAAFGGLNGLAGLVFGAGVGMLTASVFDVALLGWRPVSTADVSTARRAPSPTFLPSASLISDASHRSTPALGLSGSF
jgi:hypothetical protein